MGDSNNWTVGSVSCTESVININVSEFGKVVSESSDGFFWTFDFVSLVIFEFSLFFRVESNVFAKENLVVCSVDLINNAISDTIFKESDFSV